MLRLPTAFHHLLGLASPVAILGEPNRYLLRQRQQPTPHLSHGAPPRPLDPSHLWPSPQVSALAHAVVTLVPTSSASSSRGLSGRLFSTPASTAMPVPPEEWAAEHCSAPFRAPELWDCPSHTNIDERTDIWPLGCTLYAIMYGVSPFEYALGESGGNLQLSIINAQIKWPPGPDPPYPEPLRQFVVWLLQPHPTVQPHVDDILIHVDKLISKFST